MTTAFARALACACWLLCVACSDDAPPPEDPLFEITIDTPRTRVALHDDWRFVRGDPPDAPSLAYEDVEAWVLPTGNAFLADPATHAVRPDGDLDDVTYAAPEFADDAWRSVTVPHDAAIEGPFTDEVSSTMGRLPSPGVAWYRKTWTVPASAAGKSVFLDIDGAMSHSLVWLNGTFLGGWPYGYTSYRLDLGPALRPGEANVLAIRVDNPVPEDAAWDSASSRWYTGAGLYRDVWLVTTAPIHVGQWGTRVTTPQVTDRAATVALQVRVDNDSPDPATVTVSTDIHRLSETGALLGPAVATMEPRTIDVPARSHAIAELHAVVPDPKRWGVPPTQTPHLYKAVTRLEAHGAIQDVVFTTFGIRTIEFDGQRGFVLNGEVVEMQGVCLHHDLGALGAAVHLRARERQLEIMAEMGANAIRTAHNPFEPELLDLTDRLGFLVMDEAFDVWEDGKTALDHHTFFPAWHEQDLRALVRRDRNHPSVVMWSIGNEVLEQYDRTRGPAWAERLTRIVREEDPTRPTVAGMNVAEPGNPFSVPIDTIGLNYQGTGVRDRGAQYPTYHEAYPDKFIVGTETTSTFSTRGTYLFPVAEGLGQPPTGLLGIQPQQGIISSYDLYHADWSYAPDREFESQDRWDYVGGEFVWTGFDYLGEPTPLDAVARSSYFGIVDLAGFKKDRFYLYQARWRPDLPMAHLLPHWTWPERVGQVTPVHVYTSGDEAELFLDGVSLGRKRKEPFQYRLRWDDVVHAPGRLEVVAYKNGRRWATDSVETAGAPHAVELVADRTRLVADGRDLAFVTATLRDAEHRLVPTADASLHFEVHGAGVLVATDNGSPVDRTVFASPDRQAWSGMALAIVRTHAGQPGPITVTATSPGLAAGTVTLVAE